MRKHISRTYADNKGPDQPAHLGRLISAFIVHLENQWILKTTSMYSDDPYQITVFALSIGTPYLLTILVLVCVEVLRPSQPSGVMSSAVSLPNHTFTGQA